MLNVYKVMSENISAAISVNGVSVTNQPLIKSMRVVKKETLKLISDWISKSNDHAMVSFLGLLFIYCFKQTHTYDSQIIGMERSESGGDFPCAGQPVTPLCLFLFQINYFIYIMIYMSLKLTRINIVVYKI